VSAIEYSLSGHISSDTYERNSSSFLSLTQQRGLTWILHW